MKGNRLAGLFLILIGSLYLVTQVLGQMGITLFYIWDMWPLFTLFIGLAFEYSYFHQKRGVGLLVPGGILTTIGLLHLFESVTNWYFSAYTWPIYVLAVFIGFFHYWYITREAWALTISFILFIVFAFLTFIVLTMIFDGILTINMAFSIALILIGLFILFGNKFSK